MSGSPLRTVLVSAAAGVLGTLAALFTAGPALFSDGAFGERIVVLGVSVGAFALIGLVSGALAPDAWRFVAWSAWVPMLVVVGLFGLESLSRTDFLLLGLGFVVGNAAAVLAGALLGMRLRTRRADASDAT